MIINNESGMMWEEAAKIYFKLLSKHFPRETERKAVLLLTTILSKNLQNAS
jgi:hypothetical protein